MEMEFVQIVVLALALAFMAESMVEYIFGEVADHFEKIAPYKWLLMYIALAAGVGMAFWYQVDLISLITGDGVTVLGNILTGLAIGRGANFVHDFVSTYLPNGLKREIEMELLEVIEE